MLLIFSCASQSISEMDFNWSFHDEIKEDGKVERRACLPIEDVYKLNEIRVNKCKSE